MKIKIQGFLYQMHSWAKVNYSIGEALAKLGHEIHLVPTDTDKPCHLPEHLKQYERKIPEGVYDLQFGYTALLNANAYFQNGSKNRFLTWASEFAGRNVLPQGFAKYYRLVDKILAPSTFCKQIFVDGGVPQDHVVVVPHGINLDEPKTAYPLKTKKKYKIGMIIGQPHKRKNIANAFKAFGQAFNKNDDVCLVAKIATQNNLKGASFEINFKEMYNNFKKDFPNHAEIELITDYVENINEIYNACDIIFTMSNCEGYYMVGLEGLNAGKLNIAPRHGGQLDFLNNNNNSLLIDTKIVRAPRDYMYWQPSFFGEMGSPDIEHAIYLLRYSYENYDQIIEKFMPNIIETRNKYTWESAAKQILGLCT
jgi:glycosyltransferase involved in cell wall biosynthesis